MRARQNVYGKCSSHKRGPVNPRRRWHQRAVLEPFPVFYRQYVRGNKTHRHRSGFGGRSDRRLALIARLFQLSAWLTWLRNHLFSPRGVRSDHSMKTHEWVARWRNERRETREKFDWRHDATTRPLPACRLRPVRDAHSRYPLDAIHREDWAGTLPAKFFAPHVILRVDSHAGVHVEALRFRRGFRFHMLDRRRAIGRPDVREFTSVKRDLRRGWARAPREKQVHAPSA
jgi:hypothetical protein